MAYAPDDTIYYPPKIILNITEYDRGRNPDMNMFLVYDDEDDSVYVYGSRGYETHGNIDFAKYIKSFSNYNDLFNFISLSMGVSDGHRVSISANLIAGLTNYCEYDAYAAGVCRANELVAYDNVRLSKRDFVKYINAFLM